MSHLAPATMRKLLDCVEGPSASTRYLAVDETGATAPITKARFDAATKRGSTYAVAWTPVQKYREAGLKGQLLEACTAGPYHFVRVPPAQRFYPSTYLPTVEQWRPRNLFRRVMTEREFDEMYGMDEPFLVFAGYLNVWNRIDGPYAQGPYAYRFQEFVEDLNEDGSPSYYLLHCEVTPSLMSLRSTFMEVCTREQLIQRGVMTPSSQLVPPTMIQMKVSLSPLSGLELLYYLHARAME